MTVVQGLQIGEYRSLRASFRRALLARNKAPRTIATYLAAVDELGAFLVANGMPQHVVHAATSAQSR